MRPVVTTALVALLAACSANAESPADAAAMSPAVAPIADGAPAMVGQPAPDFTLTDVAGETVKLSDHAGKTVVLEWFNPDCPFVKHAYNDAGFADVSRKWSEQGVVWLAINSGAPGKQGTGAERNAKAIDKYGMTAPVLIDATGAVGQRYGARTTPHMYVVDSAGTLVYAGAWDNAPMGNVKGGGDRVDYVDQALSAVTAGQPVAVTATKPYGCSVKYGS